MSPEGSFTEESEGTEPVRQQELSAPQLSEVPVELAPEDFYFDGPYMVFTATYHSKRGYCCNSGCRHCPFA